MRLTLLVLVAAFAVAGLFMASRPAGANEASTDIPPVTDARAAAIAMTCASCHGTDGRLTTTLIPAIAGRPESVLRFQLLGFLHGDFPDATVMPRLVKGYTEEELAAVARYFASIPLLPEEPAAQP